MPGTLLRRWNLRYHGQPLVQGSERGQLALHLSDRSPAAQLSCPSLHAAAAGGQSLLGFCSDVETGLSALL